MSAAENVPVSAPVSECRARFEQLRDSLRLPQRGIDSAPVQPSQPAPPPDPHVHRVDRIVLAYPGYMDHLIGRAAELLQAHFPHCGPVPFTWWADGKEDAYLARLEWPRHGVNGPRVVVMWARSGQVVCMSLPGRPFDVDPKTVCFDYTCEDEIDRELLADRRANRWKDKA